MNVALYCRVSTDEQKRTGESILDQRQALERWATENGHAVAGIYEDDGFSAHKSYKSRPELRRLLEDVRAGRVDLIAFTKFDRWTRRAADYYKLQDILDAARVPWKAIEEDYETVTASGRFKVGIMLSVNQHEAERTSERIKFTFAEKRRRGEIVSGNMPKGYKTENKRPVKDPETEAGITAFWKTYLAGDGLKASICAAAAAGTRISVSSGSFILRNANAYTGAIQGVSCDPYITPEQAARVLATRRTKAAPSGWVYLFSGIIVCGECGGAMGAHRNKWKHADGSEGCQVVYNCSRRYRTNKEECANSVSVMESEIERRLLSVLSERINEEAAKMDIRIAEQKRRKKDDDGDKLRAKLERKKRRAWEAYLDELITKDDYKRTAEEIDAQLAAIPAPEIIDEDAPRRMREAMPDNWRAIYDDLDTQHRRDFWRGVLDQIAILPDRSMSVSIKGTGAGNGFVTQLQQPDGYWIEVIKADK